MSKKFNVKFLYSMITNNGEILDKYAIDYEGEECGRTKILMTCTKKDNSNQETLTFSNVIDSLNDDDRSLFMYLVDKWTINNLI